MSNVQGVLTLLGFAQKAKNVAAGDANVEAMLKKGKVCLLVMASDLSDNRKKSWQFVAEDYEIPIIELSTKIELGIAVGMSPRGIIGVTDLQMAEAIERKI